MGGQVDLDEFRRRGWRITEHGRPDTGQVVGPCGNCMQPTVLYGPLGRPWCVECRALPFVDRRPEEDR